MEPTSQLLQQDLGTLGGPTQIAIEKLEDGVEHLNINRNKHKRLSGEQNTNLGLER